MYFLERVTPMERGYLGGVPVVLSSAARGRKRAAFRRPCYFVLWLIGARPARHCTAGYLPSTSKSKRRLLLAIFCVKILRRRRISVWPKFVSSGHNLPFPYSIFRV